jgi:tryptophanyl-tRNA synthetase
MGIFLSHLFFRPDHVFVGPDQKQHLELAAELCEKANRFSKTNIFKRPNILSSMKTFLYEK